MKSGRPNEKIVSSVSPPPLSTGGLALCFQELFTVIGRLRSNRQQVSDAESFRGQIRNELSRVEQQCRELGFSEEDSRLAVFALVAFLDESILNSSHPAFADWARRPLQEEMFGVHVAGEVFFQCLQRLMKREDAHAAAELLEVYYLCLLLGYGGIYSLSRRAELQSVIDRVGRRIVHNRQGQAGIPSVAALPKETFRARRDPWVGRLKIAALATLFVALGCAGYFWLSLDSGAFDLQMLANALGS